MIGAFLGKSADKYAEWLLDLRYRIHLVHQNTLNDVFQFHHKQHHIHVYILMQQFADHSTQCFLKPLLLQLPLSFFEISILCLGQIEHVSHSKIRRCYFEVVNYS